MGLFDNPENAGLMDFGLGLLQASGPSRMPVSLGQAIGGAGQGAMKTVREMQKEQAAKALQDLQIKHMQMQMAQQEQMQPLQLEQLRGALQRQRDEQTFSANLPALLQSAMGGNNGPAPYRDQVTPGMVNSNGLPSLQAPAGADFGSFKGTPEQYLQLVAGIQDPTEKRAALEAGFRQWPQLRPTMPSEGGAGDPSLALGTLGTMVGARGMHGAEQIMKLAELSKPRAYSEGNTIVGANGQRETLPKYDVGMRPDGQGGVAAMPGMMDFLRQKAQATVDPVQAARTFYDTGINVAGNQTAGGAPLGNAMAPKDRAAVQTGAYTGGNEDWIKNSYRPTLDAAKSADNILTNVQALRNIDINTGWGTETKAAAANVLAGLGIAPKNAELFAANAQKFQSQAMTRLWEVLNTAKGPQTEGDADRAKATYASLKNTNEANQFIIDLSEANARRDKARAGFYAEAMPVARESGDLTAVDRTWQKKQRSVWDDTIMAKWRH